MVANLPFRLRLCISSSKELKEWIRERYWITAIWFHPQRNWKLMYHFFVLGSKLAFHPQRNWKGEYRMWKRITIFPSFILKGIERNSMWAGVILYSAVSSSKELKDLDDFYENNVRKRVSSSKELKDVGGILNPYLVLTKFHPQRNWKTPKERGNVMEIYLFHPQRNWKFLIALISSSSTVRVSSSKELKDFI